jgi:CAAX protease family protein
MSTLKYANPSISRIAPFALFMAFIGLDEGLRFLAGRDLVTLSDTALYYLYPVKALAVAFLLYIFRGEYSELSLKDLKNLPVTCAVCGIGLLVFALWIRMDWTYSASVSPQGFNPTLFPQPGLQLFMTLFRVGGAVLVVPLMEELFWRSFLIRYIINPDFSKISMGCFTWTSFLVTVLLFGLEHHFILAGIMAGVIYNLILYRTRSLTQCVLAHAVTNLALALYVITTGKWQFW